MSYALDASALLAVILREPGREQELPTRHAILCGELVAQTTRQGLSLGDCVCLTAAACNGSTAITADRRWQELNGRRIGNREIRVQVIR